MRLGQLGPQLDDFPETGNRLFVAVELRECVAEGVVRVDPVRMEFDFPPQHGFGTAEVSEREIAIPEPVPHALLGSPIKYLPQRSNGVLKSVLIKQAVSEKAQGFEIRRIFPQRVPSDLLGRGKIVAVDRRPPGNQALRERACAIHGTSGAISPAYFGSQRRSGSIQN